MKPVKAFFVGLLLTIVGIVSAQETPPTAPPPVDQKYVVGAEDVISVTTRDNSEFSGEFLVRADGRITFPVVGELKVEGLTLEQIDELITTSLKSELKRPEVFVTVKSMRANRIYVLGSVGNPGMLDWKPNWRLTELISAAGGVSGLPERLTALIWRRGEPARKIALKDVFIDAKEESNVEVKPGDVINIHAKPTIRVTVTGKVQKPGLIDVFEGDGVSEAVAGMGGGLPDAALSKTKIVRKGQEIPVDLYKVTMQGQTGLNVPLQDGDIINVPEHTDKVAVIGLVGKPGAMPIPDGRGLTLTEAVGQAGGVTREAKTDSVMLSRRTADGGYESKAYNIKQILTPAKNKPIEDPVLQHGDVIFIAQSGKPNSGTISSILGLILTGGGLFGRLGF
jgi:polysaccharide biosynthesis/export protein